MENKKDFKIYTLKKEYPGSPKKGTIVIESYDDYYNPLSSFKFKNKKLIEDFPDNWELQTTPDFIIKSIVSPDGYVKTGKEVMYQYAYGMYPDYKIHTIKRTSDEEEFSIGDSVSSPFSKKIIIGKIKFCEKGSFKEGFWLYYEGGASHIENIIKRTPLFKTEDGVDIFEGDSFAHTSGNTEPKVKIATTKHLNYSLPMDKLFSTKEKAEYYVKMNKKEFSRNQIIALLDAFHFGSPMKEYFINELDNQ